MRTNSSWILILVFTAALARGQDAATQQRLDEISGQIQNLMAAQGAQARQLDAMEKEISDLRNRINQAPAADNASADDLKRLATQVQEIDRKRISDNNKILKALEKISRSGGSAVKIKPADDSAPTGNNTPPASGGGTQKGYDYVISKGDTISAIAKAYRAQGVKVTTEQILAANPGLDPQSLVVGNKIWIPDPNAK